MNRTIFVIGDLHAPYHHKDALRFIAAVLKAYKPDRVVQIGDEVDSHAMSFHEHHPDLLGPASEADKAAKVLKELEAICPRLDLLESNHGSLYLRKRIAAGIPGRFMRSYNDAWGVGPGWRWHFELTLDTPTGPVYFHHGKSSNPLEASRAQGMSMVQGHFHNLFGAQYWSNARRLCFAGQTGCLVDMHSLAQEYGKNDLRRPVLGSLIIKDGHPIPIPMFLTRKGRWDGKVLGM